MFTLLIGFLTKAAVPVVAGAVSALAIRGLQALGVMKGKAAQERLRQLVLDAVKWTENAVRKNYGPTLTPEEKADIAQQAMVRATRLIGIKNLDRFARAMGLKRAQMIEWVRDAVEVAVARMNHPG